MATSDRKSYSVVENMVDKSGSKCGYCKSEDTSYSSGMWAHCMTVQDYHMLIDRGWRRSGKYCYKPKLDETCCPQYTIRCDAVDFQMTRSQKKVLKRMQHFLLTGEKTKLGCLDGDRLGNNSFSEIVLPTKMPSILSEIDIKNGNGRIRPHTSATSGILSNENYKRWKKENGEKSEVGNEVMKEQRSSEETHSSAVKKTDKHFNSSSVDFNKPVRKAKLIRRERYQHHLQQKRMDCQAKGLPMPEEKRRTPKNTALSLEERINKALPTSAAHRLEEWRPKSGPSGGFGQFHQQYWLDEKLIAVGVLDILPSCISSVYLYYDTDYSFLSLGVYSCLREIALTRSMYSSCPNLRYYYMGFYIQSIPKMKYKGRLRPSFLLCPQSYIWQPIENCVGKLDASKYARLNDDLTAVDVDGFPDLSQVGILHGRLALKYATYRQLFPDARDESEVREWAALLGGRCSASLLLYRQ